MEVKPEIPQQPHFDLSGYIANQSMMMPLQPDADGNEIPSFSEFFSLYLKNPDGMTEQDSEIAQDVYYSQIYNMPRPNKEPLEMYEESLNAQIRKAEEEDAFYKKDIEEDKSRQRKKYDDYGDGTYFYPEAGIFIDINDPSANFLKEKLEKYKAFRAKYGI